MVTIGPAAADGLGSQRPLSVGYFSFRPGLNPYQTLFANAIEHAGARVEKIAPMKLLPLQRAARAPVDVFQFDWPHDWYNGRNAYTRVFKKAQYITGVRSFADRPLVWTAHNLKRHDAHNDDYEHKMIQRLIDYCDGIIVMSKAAGSLLDATYRVGARTKVVVIPHGHFIDAYPNKVPRDEARRVLSISPDARVVLSFGRIVPYKGTSRLISGFAKFARQGDLLIIAGPTDDAVFVERLRSLAREVAPQGAEIRIVAEAIAPGHVQHYMNACDVVALSFDNILNSGSLMLAMSFGKCVVAPALGSIPETVCPSGWFPMGSGQPDSIASALYDALTCGDRQAREAAVLDFTRNRYNWDHIGRAVTTLYRSLLD